MSRLTVLRPGKRLGPYTIFALCQGESACASS